MCNEEGVTYYKPGKILATDNAAMIGCRTYYMAQAGKFCDLHLNAKPSVPTRWYRCMGEKVTSMTVTYI